MIKLVHRQTGLTSHELVKDLRNGWRAFIYQTTASLFKLSLKDVYNPREEYQDYLIEDILQRAFSDKIIDFQPTALNYDENANNPDNTCEYPEYELDWDYETTARPRSPTPSSGFIIPWFHDPRVGNPRIMKPRDRFSCKYEIPLGLSICPVPLEGSLRGEN